MYMYVLSIACGLVCYCQPITVHFILNYCSVTELAVILYL